MDEQQAWKIIDSRKISHDRGLFKLPMSAKEDGDLMAAISYLVVEWDYAIEFVQ